MKACSVQLKHETLLKCSNTYKFASHSRVLVELERPHALSAMILRASGIAIAECIAAAIFSLPRVLLSGAICTASSGRRPSSWLSSLTDDARHVMRFHSTQETRVHNLVNDVAGIIHGGQGESLVPPHTRGSVTLNVEDVVAGIICQDQPGSTDRALATSRDSV
jgi:hypothetical protein